MSGAEETAAVAAAPPPPPVKEEEAGFPWITLLIVVLLAIAFTVGLILRGGMKKAQAEQDERDALAGEQPTNQPTNQPTIEMMPP